MPRAVRRGHRDLGRWPGEWGVGLLGGKARAPRTFLRAGRARVGRAWRRGHAFAGAVGGHRGSVAPDGALVTLPAARHGEWSERRIREPARPGLLALGLSFTFVSCDLGRSPPSPHLEKARTEMPAPARAFPTRASAQGRVSFLLSSLTSARAPRRGGEGTSDGWGTRPRPPAPRPQASFSDSKDVGAREEAGRSARSSGRGSEAGSGADAG